MRARMDFKDEKDAAAAQTGKESSDNDVTLADEVEEVGEVEEVEESTARTPYSEYVKECLWMMFIIWFSPHVFEAHCRFTTHFLSGQETLLTNKKKKKK